MPTNLISADYITSYTRTALWSSLDDNGEPLDGDSYELAESTKRAFERDCANFAAMVAESGLDISAHGPDKIGHHFWLTRNAHGAGFWDGGYGPLGDKLTELAQSMGTADLYVGDDDLIYQAGDENL